MKKILAIIVSLTLALCLFVPVSAEAGRGTNSGQWTPIYADFDPQAITDLVEGLDFSGLLDDLGFGEIFGFFEDFSLNNILDQLDLNSLLGGLLGDFDIMAILNDLLGGLIPGTEDPTTAQTTTAATTAATTASGATTTAPATTKAPTDIPKTGDTGATVAIGVLAIAAAAFICTRKKNEFTK